MNTTVMGDRREMTLPAEVCEAAGLKPSDRIDWRFEGGEIRGRKLDASIPEILDVGHVDADTLLPRGATVIAESIIDAVRADREGR